MKTVNIQEAKTHLSRLVADAANGEGFIIAKAGKPVARVSSVTAPQAVQRKRLKFMKGAFSVPDDFDTLGQAEITALFEGQQ